ncbi:MAG: hypothetical protein HYZ37_13840 [Candidatus Solibacter usitatus]|nr:hypothetical protein [Candidatus Solibacter usitatus]
MLWKAAIVAAGLCVFAQERVEQVGCACDPAKPETMKMRPCSLCAEAEKHSSEKLFYLKDNNPRKPNRWLVLPSKHMAGNHPLHELSPGERAGLWKAAIAKGRELFGDGWGVAYNGPQVRTQCHAHIHIGKFVTVAELPGFQVVSRPEDIPAPTSTGVWVHPVNGKLHVHSGEQIAETVLVR